MSSDRGKILEAAQHYTIRGQIQKAIEEWKKLLSDTPNDANIYNIIGDLCLKNTSSVNAHEEAISYYMNAAHIFESTGFFLKAIAVYKKILKIAPGNKEIYLHLGDLNCERGLIGNAREDYLMAAKLFIQEGEVKEALSVYRKIADLDPSNLSVRRKIAEIFLKEGLKEEAIEEYHKVAEVYRREGNKEAAEEIYRAILRLDPDDIKAIVAIGRYYLEEGRLEEAIGYGKRAYDISPDTPEVLSLLVDSYVDSGRYEEAEEFVRTIIELVPDKLSHKELLANILVKKNDVENAAIEYLNLCREYMALQDCEHAMMFAERALDLNPDLIEAHEILYEIYIRLDDRKEEALGKGLYLAKHYHESGDIDRAKEYYTKILEEDPHNIEAQEGLGKIENFERPPVEVQVTEDKTGDVSDALTTVDVYLKYGLMEKAICELQEIVDRLDPDNEEAHLRLKDIYRSAGNQDKAIEEYLSLLRIYESTGDREKMESVINEALSINPYDWRVKEYRDRLVRVSRAEIEEFFEEARFYVQQGMVEEARDVYKRILRIDPENEEALGQLRTLEGGKDEVVIPEVEIVQDKDEEARDNFFDLEEVLREESPSPTTELARGFEEIFQEFQEGVKKQVSIEDYETHYNLGIAYKEMGLFKEAIEEFKLCNPDTSRFFDAAYMSALCYKELGEYQQAIEVLKKAISSPHYNDHRHLAMKYELAVLLEAMDRRDEALDILNQVYNTDPTYRDVTAKISHLQESV